MRLRGILMLAVSLVLAACQEADRYEISKDPSGRTVRLDKKTGELAVIDGDRLVKVKDATSLEQEKAEEQQLGETKEWNTVDIPQIGARAFLSTAWRDSKVFYKFRLMDLKSAQELDVVLNQWFEAKEGAKPKFPTPNEAAIDARMKAAMGYIPFRLELADGNGFKLHEEKVLSLVRVVSAKGSVDHLEYADSFPMSKSNYMALNSWNVGWTTRTRGP